MSEEKSGIGIRTTKNGKKRVYFQLDRAHALATIENLLPEKDDCFLADLCEDIQRKPAETVGEGRDIVVTIRPGLETHDIKFLRAIEKSMDKALLPHGFTRSKSGKWGHKVEFIYYQFAKCLEENDDNASETEEQTP